VITVKIKLGVKCKNCGNWNGIEVEKIFVNAGMPDSKLQVFLPAYIPLRTEKCSKCNKVIAKENGIIRKKKK
jgi:phage FluMu protein Com